MPLIQTAHQSRTSNIDAIQNAHWHRASPGTVADTWLKYRTREGNWTPRAALYTDLVAFVAPRAPPSRQALYAHLKAVGVQARYRRGQWQIALGIL